MIKSTKIILIISLNKLERKVNMTDKTFKIVGTSLFNGNWKVRWANDFVTRFKTLHKGGHTSIELFELPQPMTKPEATKWLSESDKFASLCENAQHAVTEKLGEYASIKPTVKISMEEIASRPVISEDAPAVESTPVAEESKEPVAE